MNYSVVVLGGVMILSVTWYYFPKYGGVHWFTGPVANIREMALQPKGMSIEEAPELSQAVDIDSEKSAKYGA